MIAGFLRDIYRLLHIFLDLLKVPSLHRNFPSAVQALMPPLLPEQGSLPRASAEPMPTVATITNKNKCFIEVFLYIFM